MGTLIERARTITKLFPIHILMSWCLSESSWRTISFRDTFSACVCSQRPQLQLWNSWVCRGLPRLTAASCSKSWRSFRKFASRQNFGAVCVGDVMLLDALWVESVGLILLCLIMFGWSLDKCILWPFSGTPMYPVTVNCASAMWNHVLWLVSASWPSLLCLSCGQLKDRPVLTILALQSCWWRCQA